MNHARKPPLFSNEKTRMKREGNLIYVTMEACDDAEVCQLVGTF